MPYYDYRCPSCGVFEQRRPMDQSDNAECPTCKQTAARMLSAPFIAGSGASYEVASGCGATDMGCGAGMSSGGGCGMGGCGHVH